MENIKWTFVGDKTLKQGGTWIKKNGNSKVKYSFVSLQLWADTFVSISEGVLSINNKLINKKAVEDYSGITSEQKELFIAAALDFYGNETFNQNPDFTMFNIEDQGELKNFSKKYGIQI